jgi:hypothetical protein
LCVVSLIPIYYICYQNKSYGYKHVIDEKNISSQDMGWYCDRMIWIKKWGIEEEHFPDEPLVIRDLVQERVIMKLWKESSEKMGFDQSDINIMITYTEKQYLQEKILSHNGGNRELE